MERSGCLVERIAIYVQMAIFARNALMKPFFKKMVTASAQRKRFRREKPVKLVQMRIVRLVRMP